MSTRSSRHAQLKQTFRKHMREAQATPTAISAQHSAVSGQLSWRRNSALFKWLPACCKHMRLAH